MFVSHHLQLPAGRKRPARSPRRLAAGVGLIEVMVAVLVLGVGLLGVAAMQVTALRNNQSALERTQATIQTYSIIDAMRANRQAAVTNAYNLPMACTAPSGGTLAQNDLNRWIGSLKTTLGDNPGSCGQVACNGANCVITVRWDDSRATEGRTGAAGATTEQAGETARQVVTRAQL